MFTLDELKETAACYRFNSYTKKLENCFNSSAKKVDDLSQEEKNRIISSLYLDELVFGFAYRKKNDNPQELLDEIQTDFYQDILTPNIIFFSSPNKICASIIEDLLLDLTNPDEKSSYMPEIYMQYILNENGKKATNIHREVENNDEEEVYSIQYDIEDLDKKNDFQKSLAANNPQWTQPVQKIELSPQERANRRAYVEKYIQYYNIAESTGSYIDRVQTEEKHMQQVAYIVNNHEQMTPINSLSELFYLLNAAQNLTLDYGKDFLEELLSQPQVDKALLNFKSSKNPTELKEKALSIKREIQVFNEYIKNLKAQIEDQEYQERTLTEDYKVTNKLLEMNKHHLRLLKNPPTSGEIDRKAANECLANSQEPDFLLRTAKTLKTIQSDATDITSSLSREEKTKLSLIRVAMRQQGKIPSNMIIENGTISIEEQENQNIL